MIQYFKYISLFSIILFFAACHNSKQVTQSKEELSHSQENSHKFKILGTKGSGEPPIFGYGEYEPNSIQSISYALEKVDGAEIDLQISSDSTLWLFEHEKIKDCRSLIQNFSSIDDIELNLASRCWHHFQLVTLDSLIQSIQSIVTASKTISFDLSFMNQVSTQNQFGGKEALVKIVMNRLNKTIKGQPFKVLFEVPNERLLSLVKNQTDAPVFFKLNKELKTDELKGQNISADINIFKTKELKPKMGQISGIRYLNDMFYAINQKIPYIQTENIDLGNFFSKMSTQKLKDTVLYEKKYFGTDNGEDKLLIADLKSSDWEGSAIIRLTIDSIVEAGAFTMTFVTYNADGVELSLNGEIIEPKVENYWHFLNEGQLSKKKCTRMKIYIFNRNKLNFRFRNLQLNKWNY